MKKLLALLLVLSMIFVFGCTNNEDEATSVENDATTETTENGATETTENDASANSEKAESKKEEKKEPVKTDHIKEADDIKTVEELSTLIEESNDKNTSPERKAELLEIIGAYLNSAEEQAIELPSGE